MTLGYASDTPRRLGTDCSKLTFGGTMGDREEAAVRAFVAEFDCDEFSDAIPGMVQLMSPEIHYHVYAWERPIVGRDAVRDELVRQSEMGFGGLRSQIVTMASANNLVFVERLDSMTIRRRPITVHAAAVFEVDREGKILSWRDYYDSREITTKLGIDALTAGARGYDT
jgi:limonene-1,2-epoxide hydrolase